MFKQKCRKCGEKVNKKYNFCPYCQAPLKSDEDWGFLGKNDFDLDGANMPLGLNALFNSLLKNLNNQMNDLDQMQNGKNKVRKGKGISISISTADGRPPEIKVRSFGNQPQEKIIQEKKKLNLPETDPGRFAGLPKKEPETTIRRFSDKVVYEINMPGVNEIKDVSIIQLENSIEIKALANKKVFHKIIPVNLPISKYILSKGILTLELDFQEQ